MIQALLSNQQWQTSKDWRAEQGQQCDVLFNGVLMVTSSLTRFLEQKYALRLDVSLLDQGMSKANATEARLLGIDESERCLRRKVSLKSRGEVMFDAESVLPLDVLPLELMQELEAGTRPLADLLSDRGLLLSRSGLSITKISDEGFYHDAWARRSVLSSESGAKALVTEVFHEAMWRKLRYKTTSY